MTSEHENDREEEVLDMESTELTTAATPEEKTPANVDELLQTAVSHGATVEQLERIMALRRELQGEKSRNDYYEAMAALQSALPEIRKDKAVYDKSGAVRYRYADSAAIMRALRPLMQKYGFSLSVRTEQTDSSVTAIADVHHSSGHKETTTFSVPIDKDAYMSEPQKVASALTFARRYAIIDAFGIATADEDDDANLSFEDGRQYGAFVDGLEACTTLDELRNIAKQYVTELREAKDERGRKVIMASYERRKNEIENGEA